MYDSDEVRDEVRGAILWGTLPSRQPEDYSAAERAAIKDALLLYWQERRRLALEAIAKLEELVKEAIESFAAALRALGSDVIEAVAAIERLGLVITLPEQIDAGYSIRPRRRRRAYVRPLHLVDAVAGGRHPAMIMRTRIRGGRR